MSIKQNLLVEKKKKKLYKTYQNKLLFFWVYLFVLTHSKELNIVIRKLQKIIVI